MIIFISILIVVVLIVIAFSSKNGKNETRKVNSTLNIQKKEKENVEEKENLKRILPEIPFEYYEDSEYVKRVKLKKGKYGKDKICFTIVGTSHRNKHEISAANIVKKGEIILLEKESDNEFDKNAVKVLTLDGYHIGYVSSGKAQIISDYMKEQYGYAVVDRVEEHIINDLYAYYQIPNYEEWVKSRIEQIKKKMAQDDEEQQRLIKESEGEGKKYNYFAMTWIELSNRQKNIQSSITRRKNQLNYQSAKKLDIENPMPPGKERDARLQEIAVLEREMAIVEEEITKRKERAMMEIELDDLSSNS